MADTVLPVDSANANYTLSVTLSGIPYQLQVYWNVRASAWIADILSQDGTPILNSIPLQADLELLYLYMETGIPPGFLYCLDMSGQSVDPASTDLGSRVVLVYDDGLS